MHRDLADPELFGNEAGEDEDVQVLASYFLAKQEFDRFYSPTRRFGIVRSRKGVGKSALLKQTMYRREIADAGELLIYCKASDLVALQDVKSDSPAELIYGWQQRLCSRVNLELGSNLRLAVSDDAIALVEGAELSGFKGRNLVSALLDRLQVRAGGIEVARVRQVPSNSEALLRRVLEKKDTTAWLFVDDIDATFLNTETERLRASTFFSACRNLVNTVMGLNIRVSVRTDVWSILAQHDESLDKCEQYMLDLQWSTVETGRILENKILSYFQRFYPENGTYASLVASRDQRKIFGLIFKEPFHWGTRTVEPFRPIHVLSAGRPRWAAQLCKLAGKDAFAKATDRIALGHVRAVLRDYGQSRVSDLYKEHRHQCPNLQDIIETFSGGPAKYNTSNLLRHLTDKVIQRWGMPELDGAPASQGSISLAHFLYRVGFIAARDESDPGGLGFVRYEDRPNLLSSTANLDDGLDWEIHPGYRDVLRIQAPKTQAEATASIPTEQRVSRHRESRSRGPRRPRKSDQ
ncbi:MAG TPA: hypothetical protein VFJ16_16670 [Longimicrobium sp.]|nr:hypothetical protein [Longimicrobium sp.]